MRYVWLVLIFIGIALSASSLLYYEWNCCRLVLYSSKQFIQCEVEFDFIEVALSSSFNWLVVTWWASFSFDFVDFNFKLVGFFFDLLFGDIVSVLCFTFGFYIDPLFQKWQKQHTFLSLFNQSLLLKLDSKWIAGGAVYLLNCLACR